MLGNKRKVVLKNKKTVKISVDSFKYVGRGKNRKISSVFLRLNDEVFAMDSESTITLNFGLDVPLDLYGDISIEFPAEG